MLEILNPGLMCTVQDAGRFGFQHLGVGPAGPMDWASARLANLIVGNDEGEPVLEFTGATGMFRLRREALVCRVGAGLDVDGVWLPGNRPIAVKAGATVRLDASQTPFRSYVAISGGLRAPQVLGSASASTVALLDTFESRGLRKGKQLTLGEPSAWSTNWCKTLLGATTPTTSWAVCPLVYAGKRRVAPLRVVRDARGHCEDEAWRHFVASQFRIGTQSNRMGYRLEGPELPPGRAKILSHGVVTGTIQLPPGGKPIVLMADRQTTGGYPVLGHVCAADIPMLGVQMPGSVVSFREISVEEAHVALARMNVGLQRRKHTILSMTPAGRYR